MSFDYDKIAHKSQGEHGSWWTSYADLFMMLSIVFLLMYVASSLRSGTAGLQQQQAYEQLQKKAQDLQEQITVYNTLKEKAVQQSSQSEQEVYQKLMDKLTLLRDDADQEKLALQQKAKENEDKEFALNQYQQIVRNIINTNILAKSQILHRDQVIQTKDETIQEKQKTIADLQGTLAENQSEIESINTTLADKIQALKQERKHSKISKTTYERRITNLRQRSEQQVQKLQDANGTITAQLNQVQGTLAQTEQSLNTATVTIQQQQQDNSALKASLQQEEASYVAELGRLKAQHQAQLAAERAAFERNLKREQLSHAAKARRLAEFAARERAKAGALAGELSGLEGKIADTRGQLAEAEAAKNRALANVQGLQGDLAREREIANARRKLARAIANQFAKSGLKGSVDGRTGEVTLDFGQEYFDTGSTLLKPGMRVTLDKFIPAYAKSLFSDPRIAGKIGSVEIIGFASSTYKGRYINPTSVEPQDKVAIDYNLKLSFGRADSIFKHVLNEKKLSKADRDHLLSLMKVVGRGYLPDGVASNEIPDSMTEKQFCARYNCKKAQKVIVKFTMKD